MPVRGRHSCAPESFDPIEEAVHGAIDPSEMRRRGIDPDRILDFSTNVQPFGPSPRVREAVSRAVLDRYPDRECVHLREVISAREGIPLERIVVGNGSSELLQSFAQAFLRPGDHALVLGPTYAEYARASRLAGAGVEECRATADSRFAVPLERFAATLREHSPKVAFLCNPNNPTGQLLEAERILNWVACFRDTHFVVDESYLDFVAEAASVAQRDQCNLTVLRSLTKSHALAGLRLGYAVADPEVIRMLCRRRIPWSVSAPAQAAGIAAIQDREHLEVSMSRLREAKRKLVEELRGGGWSPLPSATNFFLLPVEDPPALRERLLSEQILVRDCHSFGIANHIRIGVRSSEENAQLLAALVNPIKSSAKSAASR